MEKKSKKPAVDKKKEKIFGKELILDISDCSPRIIRSRKKILEYSDKLCRLIKVKKYGRPVIARFGGFTSMGEGYTLIQLIETSSLVCHFVEISNSIFINIFSCRQFDDRKAESFTKNFFNAKKIKRKVLKR